MTHQRPSLGESAVPNALSLAIMQAICEQSQSNDFSDVTIVVEGVEFQSHRFILSAVSGFFRGLLKSGMVEDIQRRTYLPGISLDTFTLLLSCIFKGNDILTTDNVIDVWHAASLLDIPFLFSHCEDFITDHLTGDNCIDVYLNAKLLDSSNIMLLSWEILLQDFDTLRFSNDILTLSLDDMKKLVTSPNLKAKSEDDVVDLIIRWISCTTPIRKCQSLEQIFFRESDFLMSEKKHSKDHRHREKFPSRNSLTLSANKRFICDCSNPVQELQFPLEADDGQTIIKRQKLDRDNQYSLEHSREAHVVELLMCSRYCLISGWILQELLSNKIILKNEDAVSLVKQSIQYQVEPSRRHDYLPTAAIFRNCSDLENVIIWTTEELNSHSDEVTFLNYMSVASNRVTKLSFGEKIDDCKFAVSGNNIFVADNKQCRRFFCLDKNIDQLSWFYPRTGHTVVAVGDCIYVVGGCQKHVQRLNVNRSNVTERVGSISVGVSCTTAGVIRKNIIVLGKPEDKADLTVVQCFNTQTMISYRVTNIHSSAKNLVVFHKGDWMFVLFGTGAVWKLEETGPGVIYIRYGSFYF